MRNDERELLRAERGQREHEFQGMLGYLKMATDSYDYRVNQVLTNDLKDFDWDLFEKMTKEARDIQAEANQTLLRLWQIDHTLMNNPNTKEILRGGGGVLGAKLRAKQIEKYGNAEMVVAEQALSEWNQRVEKVAELRKVWDK